jgi:hypothetical protein
MRMAIDAAFILLKLKGMLVFCVIVVCYLKGEVGVGRRVQCKLRREHIAGHYTWLHLSTSWYYKDLV